MLFGGGGGYAILPYAEMNIFCFPLLALHGNYHYWTYVIFPGGLSKCWLSEMWTSCSAPTFSAWGQPWHRTVTRPKVDGAVFPLSLFLLLLLLLLSVLVRRDFGVQDTILSLSLPDARSLERTYLVQF